MKAEEAKVKRKVGRFRLPADILRFGALEHIKKLFGEMIIWRAEPYISPFGTYSDAIEYMAVSEYFDEVVDGEFVPEYRFLWHRNPDGSVTMLPVEKV